MQSFLETMYTLQTRQGISDVDKVDLSSVQLLDGSGGDSNGGGSGSPATQVDDD
eukprot:SAG11_NODE_9378_length_917_cov_2.788509_1_plen_54_part_00